MNNIQSTIFIIFVILVVLNIFFVFAAAQNTLRGESFFPHGFNAHKLFDESLYTQKGNKFRKRAVYCWLIELPLLVIWLLSLI